MVNHTDFKLKFYRTENVLTKKFLINLIKENPIYIRYLPDAVNLDKLSKSFLFTVSKNIIVHLIANLDPPTYGKLYDIYKNKESNKSYKKWEDYELSLPGNVLNKVVSFRPINRYIYLLIFLVKQPIRKISVYQRIVCLLIYFPMLVKMQE